MITAPIIGLKRHCIATDGQGVTTLVAFYGCPLRCKYCINPQCFNKNTICRTITPQELRDEVAIDNLYFLATGGGVTFGGGEPLLRSKFISEFCKITPHEWNISLETSLNVSKRHLEEVIQFIDHFFIDVKDLEPVIYKKYTSTDNIKVYENLQLLAAKIPQNKITIRLPLIYGYNNEEKRKASIEKLKRMGFDNFDLFKYIIKNNTIKQ